MFLQSLPSRERGLKCLPGCKLTLYALVAPLAGAWIEIYGDMLDTLEKNVAPLAGAWIEILSALCLFSFCGVAPLAGAWIEIHDEIKNKLSHFKSLPSRERGLKYTEQLFARYDQRRSPRGSVD